MQNTVFSGTRASTKSLVKILVCSQIEQKRYQKAASCILENKVARQRFTTFCSRFRQKCTHNKVGGSKKGAFYYMVRQVGNHFVKNVRTWLSTLTPLMCGDQDVFFFFTNGITSRFNIIGSFRPHISCLMLNVLLQFLENAFLSTPLKFVCPTNCFFFSNFRSSKNPGSLMLHFDR